MVEYFRGYYTLDRESTRTADKRQTDREVVRKIERDREKVGEETETEHTQDRSLSICQI